MTLAYCNVSCYIWTINVILVIHTVDNIPGNVVGIVWCNYYIIDMKCLKCNLPKMKNIISIFKIDVNCETVIWNLLHYLTSKFIYGLFDFMVTD